MVKKLRIWRRRSASILRIIGRALRSAIPTVVLVVAVPIAFSVRFVVLIVVRDEIIEGEAVMRGNEVDAAHRVPVELREDV